MSEAPVHHTHANGVTHGHTTTLVPNAVELLQQVEDFAASLQSEAAIALRRLVRSGVLADATEWTYTAVDAQVYDPAWYRALIATQHEHPPAAPVEEPFFYLPPWWPVPAARRARPSRAPPDVR
jgi:hypothetical protein